MRDEPIHSSHLDAGVTEGPSPARSCTHATTVPIPYLFSSVGAPILDWSRPVMPAEAMRYLGTDFPLSLCIARVLLVNQFLEPYPRWLLCFDPTNYSNKIGQLIARQLRSRIMDQ